MKQYFNVSFQYSENVYCANIARAEKIQDVEQHYSKYSWFKVTEANESDIKNAERKGMPIIEIEPAPEKVEPAPAKRATAKAKVNSEKTLAALKNQFVNLYMNHSRMRLIMKSAHVSVSDGNSKIGNTCGNVSTAPVLTCGGCCEECDKYCYAVRSYNRLGNDSDGKDNLCKNPWFINTAILLQDRNRFFAAPKLEMKNPYNLPEAHVNFADESLNTCEKPESMRYHCPGNCAKCRFCGAGCWFLENGAAVLFDQH